MSVGQEGRILEDWQDGHTVICEPRQLATTNADSHPRNAAAPTVETSMYRIRIQPKSD